jgi:hypothetical protein
MTRFANLLFTGVVCLVVSMVVVSMMTSGQRDISHTARAVSPQGVSEGRISGGSMAGPELHPSEEQQVAPNATAATAKFAVSIHRPTGPPQVELAGSDPQGRSANVACSTCHSVRPPNLENKTAQSLDEFHRGLQFQHGQLACYACHNPNNADALRLADGSTVEYVDVLTLCSQCHSKQAESFAHGAHGGMNGFWDLSRGPQTKNNCIDCHDPHAPNYPKMVVDFKPRDRFLDAREGTHDDHQ